MEIYDKAHELEAAIKECQEYKDLVAAGQELAKDEKTKHLVRDFLMLQAQLAYAQSMGDKPIRKKIDHLNQMAEPLTICRSSWSRESILSIFSWRDVVFSRINSSCCSCRASCALVC